MYNETMIDTSRNINTYISGRNIRPFSSQYLWRFIEYLLYIHLCIHMYMRVCGTHITIYEAYERAHAFQGDPWLLCKRNKIDYLTSILHT